MWQEVGGEMLQDALSRLAEGEEQLTFLPADAPAAVEARALLQEARYNCEFVQKAAAAHNPDYAMDLLDHAINAIEEAIRLERRAAPPAERGRLTHPPGVLPDKGAGDTVSMSTG
jgi:DNA-dependent RNA polymerase auxiliary subunit epsilon